jgi:parallel beta-helix repeat protein
MMSRNRWNVAVVATAAMALFGGVPVAGAATVYHVDGASSNCSDSGRGDSGQPFCSIGRGAAIAQAGDTVIVHEATYAETVTVPRSGTSVSPIVFQGASGEPSPPVVTGGTYGFRVSGRQWITIQGFTVTNTVKKGFYVSSGSNVSILGNDVSSAGERISGQIAQGIYLKGTSNSLVVGNTVHDNSDHGIHLASGTIGATVRGNTVFNNARGYTRAAAGIHLAESDNNVIDANLAYANEDTGFNVRGGSQNNLIARNTSWSNGDHGFDTLQATGTRYIANTAYGNFKDGISVEGSSTGTVVANCISARNGNLELWVDSGSISGFSADYDILWDPGGAAYIKYGESRYSTLGAFRAATPHEGHGIEADPMFVDPVPGAGGDYHLRSGSPAIDSANSGAPGHPDVDLEGNPRVNDPAMPDSGAGPRPYDDRGAYERQVSP